MVFQPSSTFNDIIKLEFENTDDNTLTFPLAPLYNNDGTSNSVVISLVNYVFVPLYTNKLNDIDSETINNDFHLSKQKEIQITIENYIDYIYEEFTEIVKSISFKQT